MERNVIHNGLYAICDNVAGIVGPLFEVTNDNVAAKAFFNQTKGVNSAPGDFSLWKHGETLRKDECEIDIQLYDKSIEIFVNPPKES